jgi:hypothetical protein
VKTGAVDRFNEHGARSEKRLRMSEEWKPFSTSLNEYIVMCLESRRDASMKKER